MKRISILLMLMALFGPLAMMGQMRGDLTVADQTGMNETIPFYGYYSDDNYQHTQTIYPSTMLTQMQGGQITKLTYYLRDAVTKDFTSTYEVRIGTTNSTSFNQGTVNYISVTSSPVWTGSISLDNSTIVEFDFSSNPYTYTGGNLVVDVRLSTTNSGYAHTYFLGESASTYYSVQKKASNSSTSNQPPYTQGDAVSFMPKTTFTYTKYLNDDATIGTGTSTDGYVPLYGNYEGSYDQMIYTAAQLSDQGIDMACTITKIGFNSSATNSQLRNPVLYMGNTNKSKFDNNTDFVNVSGNMTKVYDYTNNHGQWSIVQGWNEFELDTPFEYDGSSNLIIALYCADAGGYMSTSFYYTSTTNNQAIYAYADNKDPNPATYDGSWSSYPSNNSPYAYTNYSNKLPNLKVYYSYEEPSCMKPKDLTVSNILHNQATIGWTSSESAWQIVWSTNENFDPDAATPTNANTNSHTITGLNPLTDYYAYVRSNCTANNNGYSDWSSVIHFKTTAVATVVGDGWSDDFEGTLGWDLVNGTQTNQWAWGTAANNGGTHSLYISNDNGTSNAYSTGSESFVYATKLLTFANDKYEFTFDWQANGESNYDYLRAWLAPSSASFTPGELPDGNTSPFYYTSTTPTGWISLDGGGKLNLQSAWQNKKVVADLTAGNYYLVFMWCNDGGSGNTPPAAVDNVSITRVKCPYDVENLAVSGTPTETSATVIWTAGSASQWQVEYSTSSSFPAGSSTQTVSSATATLSPLQPSSTYYVRVRSYCGGTDYGTWSSVISVNTACGAITTLPWTEDFTGLTSGIPNCWDNSEGTTTSNDYKWNYYNDGNTASPCLRFNSYSNSDGNTNFLKTPVLDLSSWSDVTLSFAFKNPTGGDFSVYISTDGGSTYTTLLQGGLTGQTTWDEIEDLDLSDYDGEDNVVIVFKGTSNWGSGDAYIYLDDVRVEGTPSSSCTRPQNLTVTNITKNSATVTWDKQSTQEEQTVYFQFTCVAHGTAVNWTGAGYAIDRYNNSDLPTGYASGLTPDTEYDFYVRRFCGTVDPINGPQPQGDEDFSTAVMVTFTTLEACPAPTNLTVSNLAASHATVSWDSEAGNYTVKYSTATVEGTTLDPVFEDGFENGLTGWTTYAVGNYTGSGYVWQQILGSNFSGTSAHNGSYVAMSRSYGGDDDQSVDNWLVTPQMTLGDVVKFWVCGDNAGWQEYFTVYVSTGTNAISDFVQIATPELAPDDGTWAERTVDLSAYAGQQGYVAIRHTDEGKDYLFVDDFRVYNTINTYSYGGWTTVSPNPTTESCPITGLSAETLYAVQVQANCGGSDGSSAWSTIYFTTPDNCGAPQELASSNITATTATLSWADDKDSYNLQYRKVYFHEGFEGGTLPTGWTTIDANNDGLTWGVGHATTHSGSNGAYNVSYVYNVTGTTPDDYLVSPLLDLQGTLRVWLSGYPRQSSNYSEHFAIYISTNGNTASDFTTTLVAETITTNSYVEYTADLSSYAGQQGYIAIRHFNCTDQYYLYVDDFGLYGSENWVTLSPNPTSETANLTGLTPNTGYEWQVRGVNCDGNGGTTEWSDVATFTTLEGYIKHIDAYYDTDGTTIKGGYYLIASPIGDVDPTQVANMITPEDDENNNTYDLYSFDQNPDDNLEWRNYRQGDGFNLEAGKGYLYGNLNTVDLVFTGTPYVGDGKVTLTYSDSNEDTNMHGWNLIGNPFAETANIGTRAFYRMNESGTEIKTATGAIAAMEGIFVIAENDEETLTFIPGEPQSKSAALVMDISRDNRGGAIDRAIVRFGNESTLPKFQLNPNHTKVYMPVEGKDYAVANADNQGTMPVNFKAENNGSYTLSFTNEGVRFAYLHLIDNMTGNDVDLLAGASTGSATYTFNAKTTDYESRFKLVFATGNNSNDDTFAFYSNGSFVINNEGEATLQVIDINGRILKSESINGCANVNVKAAAGVYMLRLVNGDNVKVQKVVVR